VENAVKQTCKEIYTEVERLHCRDIKSLNAAIRSEMKKYNNKPLHGRSYSRYGFLEIQNISSPAQMELPEETAQCRQLKEKY
jgi:hypothetical protein